MKHLVTILLLFSLIFCSGSFWTFPTFDKQEPAILIAISGTGTGKVTLAGAVGSVVTVIWGDGTSTSVTLSGSSTDYTHAYTSANTTINIIGAICDITILNTAPTSGVTQTLNLDTVNLCNLLTLYFSHGSGNFVSMMNRLRPVSTVTNGSGSVGMTGRLSNLSANTNTTYISLTAGSAITDNIDSFSGFTSLSTLRVRGCSAGGNIGALMQLPLTTVTLSTLSGVMTYTNPSGTCLWAKNNFSGTLNGSPNITAEYIANMFIDMAAYKWTGTSSIDVRGCNGGSCTDTDIGATIVANLRTAGMTVTTDGA